MPQQQLSSEALSVCAFVSCYGSFAIVNKYVLSVLDFTYPTIFQGWQTFIGMILLYTLRHNNHVELNVSTITYSSMAKWLPAMMCYVVMIYSGSIALSKLPIPVFLCMHNLTVVVSATAEMALRKKMLSLMRYPMLMMVIISTIAVANTDIQYKEESYIWLSVHIISNCAFNIYESATSRLVNLSEVQKVFSCYVYSVMLFAPSSYLLGHIAKAQSFKFLYFYEFYTGCIISGVLCGLLALSVISVRAHLHRTQTHVIVYEQLCVLAKILTVFVSYIIYPYTYTYSHLFWIVVNLTVTLMSTESRSTDTITYHIEPTHYHHDGSISSGDGRRPHNKMTLTTRLPHHQLPYTRHPHSPPPTRTTNTVPTQPPTPVTQGDKTAGTATTQRDVTSADVGGPGAPSESAINTSTHMDTSVGEDFVFVDKL